jgi:ABC-type Fe3+-hydroxamate transport system substrate-binding protein
VISVIRTAVVAGLAALAVGLSGCGTTEEPAAAQPSGTASAQPVSVTDYRNKVVDLKAPATRVVTMEWGATESLITLGVMPVGVADTKGYSTWVTSEKLDPAVKDVGKRGEVSVDAVVALNPDLVVATSDETPGVISQLEKYVPVLVVRGSSATDPIGQLKTNLELLAKATGKSDVATTEIAAFDKKVAEGKQAVAAAGKAGGLFTMADGYKQGSTISIRMYATGSLLGRVLTELGLKNGWTAAGDKDYGLASTDVEGLTKLGNVDFLYIANKNDGGDVFGEDLAKNAIWKGLPFVKAGTVHRLPDGIWMFGGPRSTAQFIDAAVQALTA